MITVQHEHQIEANKNNVNHSMSIRYTVSGDLNANIKKGHQIGHQKYEFF